MKRTFTAAAAVLVGGAGAVGFAATATAAETPQLPASLPTDNGAANTAFHAAGTLASAQKTVGDVVPLEEHLAGRSGDPVSQVVGGTPAAGLLKPVVETVQNASTGHTHNLNPASALDEAPLPVGSTLPAGKSGLPGLDALGPVSDVVGGLPVADALPVGKSGATGALPTTLTGTLQQVTQSPQTKPGQLPTNVVGDTVSNVAQGNTELGGAPLPTGKTDPVSGLVGGLPVVSDVQGMTGKSDPVGGLVGGLPVVSDVQGMTGKSDPVGGLAGGLPVVSDVQGLTGKTGAPLDKVNDVVSHGPLGSTTQLGN